jgi:hypothetical protein
MASSETGHEKNVANFDVFISSVLSMGEAYKPAKSSLSIESMQSVCTSCKGAMTATRAADAAYRNAVDAREAIFLKLDKVVTRVINTLASSDVSSETVTTAKSIVKKLRGSKSNSKKRDAEKASDAGSGEAAREISSSQLSFDNKIGNFSMLLELLLSIVAYQPNEKDLTTESLKLFLDELKNKNTAVVNARTALFNARALRDEIMYKDGSGLVDVVMDAKKYIKGAFGSTSAQYKMVSGLEFRKN